MYYYYVKDKLHKSCELRNELFSEQNINHSIKNKIIIVTIILIHHHLTCHLFKVRQNVNEDRARAGFDPSLLRMRIV